MYLDTCMDTTYIHIYIYVVTINHITVIECKDANCVSVEEGSVINCGLLFLACRRWEAF